jgi:hypothetical protein
LVPVRVAQLVPDPPYRQSWSGPPFVPTVYGTPEASANSAIDVFAPVSADQFVPLPSYCHTRLGPLFEPIRNRFPTPPLGSLSPVILVSEVFVPVMGVQSAAEPLYFQT